MIPTLSELESLIPNDVGTVDGQVQIRDESGAIDNFGTIEGAFMYAAFNPYVWKISYTDENGQRRRFVRKTNIEFMTCIFVEEPLMEAVLKVMEAGGGE